MSDETETLTIPEPLVRPLGTPVTYDALQQVWDVFVKPHQLEETPPSVEMRVLMAVLRSVAAGVADRDTAMNRLKESDS